MQSSFQPIQVPSLKAACIQHLEHLILSGQLKIKEKLPPERQLAAQLQVSRPVVHEALVDLAAKGLVSIIPRHGIIVNDFRTTGSCSLLSSLLAYHEGQLDPAFFDSLLDMRQTLESEIARLAALNRSEEDLSQLRTILHQEEKCRRQDLNTLVDLDFNFHLRLALASGNMMYPLILNSFMPIYTNLTSSFFNSAEPQEILTVHEYHIQLVAAIGQRSPEESLHIMQKMLMHGADVLRKQYPLQPTHPTYSPMERNRQ